MGLEFLARVRTTSMIAVAFAAIFVVTYVSPAWAGAFVLGALWSLLNLVALEKIVVGLTTPRQDSAAMLRRAGGGAALLFALLAVGAVLLSRLDPVALLVGFGVPFAIIILKALSLVLVSSAFWRRLTAPSGRTLGMLAACVLLVWAARPLIARAQEGGHGAGTETHPSGSGVTELPTFITLIENGLGADHPVSHFLHTWENVIFSLLVAAILIVVTGLALRRPTTGVPGRFQNAVEMVMEQLHDFFVGILGPTHGPRYVPYLGTLFLYIIMMNLFGLIPFMKSATSSLNITAALGLTTFAYVQFEGIRNLGIVGYLDHLAGNPRSVIQWGMVPLMLPIHVLGELAKPISLSCRLFGNIFGEDMLLVAFMGLGVSILAFTHLPFGIPLHWPLFIGLALLSSTLQALIFSVLSSIYFLLMLPHEHEAEAHH